VPVNEHDHRNPVGELSGDGGEVRRLRMLDFKAPNVKMSRDLLDLLGFI